MSSSEIPGQLKTQAGPTEKPALPIQFDESQAIEHLTDPSLIHLTRRLGEFTLMSLRFLSRNLLDSFYEEK
jgi:hypothetical protein